MSHKSDSPNLTKKSSGLLKDWWSICLSSLFLFMERHKRLSRIFSGNLQAMFAECLLHSFLSGVNNCFNLSLSLSITFIRHRGLFFSQLFWQSSGNALPYSNVLFTYL